MRLFLLSLAVMFGALISPAVHAEPARVLLVVSGHGRDQGRTSPGFEMDELAQAWAVFRDNGFAVELASPAGGAVEPGEYEPDKSYNARLLADAEAMRWIGATRTTASVDPRDYAAIYVLGGGGAMFDLYADPALQALLARAYEAGAVVGGVCHGLAVFANVRLSNGAYLVEGRRLTGFTNAEEEVFGERWSATYPMLLQNALAARGALFEQAPLMLPHVVADGRIVTGQNPFSTALTVEAMLRAMGREPVAREPYADERSLLLVARFLRGERAEAVAALAARPEAHDIQLIGIYGDIVAATAGEDRDRLAAALALMEMAAARLFHPRLELAMAGVEQRLGRTPAARERLERVLERNPDMEAARQLLATLGG
jgi:putative intracellular protease/amidase